VLILAPLLVKLSFNFYAFFQYFHAVPKNAQEKNFKLTCFITSSMFILFTVVSYSKESFLLASSLPPKCNRERMGAK